MEPVGVGRLLRRVRLVAALPLADPEIAQLDRRADQPPLLKENAFADASKAILLLPGFHQRIIDKNRHGALLPIALDGGVDFPLGRRAGQGRGGEIAGSPAEGEGQEGDLSAVNCTT